MNRFTLKDAPAMRRCTSLAFAMMCLLAGCSTQDQTELPEDTPPNTEPEINSEPPVDQAEQLPLILDALPAERTTHITLPGDTQSSATATHLGDIDGDGFGDMALLDFGADLANPGDTGTDNAAGAVWIVYGQPNRLPTLDVVSSMASGESFVITGPATTATDRASLQTVVPLGDINADGLDDLAVFGAFGDMWIIYGGDRRSEPLSVETLGTADGFVIALEDTYRVSINRAGDWNGDGTGDLLLGTVNTEPDEATGLTTGGILLFGVPGTRATISISDLTAGSGVLLGTRVADARLGQNLTALGDFNGDGLDDIAISAPGQGFSYEAGESGRVFVLFGTRVPQPLLVDMDALPAERALTLTQANGLPYLGAGLSGADTNGDGLSDLLIGALAAPRQADSINYLIHGSTSFRPSPVSVDAEATTSGAVLKMASGDFSSHFISDVNGDGVRDVLIEESTRRSIESYVKYRYLSILHTPSTGFTNETNIGTLLSSGQGYAIQTTETVDVDWQLTLSAQGDIDADGMGDLLLGYRVMSETVRRSASIVFSQ